ncbi:hypothetical protein BGZ94_007636 [Podila epigama]|nr:hypothetical protein BGZ94_007636 [Podila epigama]
MTRTHTPHRGLRNFHLFLSVLALVLIGLNVRFTVYLNERLNALSEKRRLASHDQLSAAYREITCWLLIPTVAMFLMYLILAIGRPRLNMSLHSACRVIYGLAIAGCVLYMPAKLLDDQRTVYTVMTENALELTSFADVYFCKGFNGISSESLFCQLSLSRDILSFLAGLLMVAELVVAHLVGDINKKV